MYKLLLFLKKIYVLLLFILLESLCLHFYASSTSYTRSRLLTASNRYVGNLHAGLSYVGHYFVMGRENRILTGEVARLRNQLARYESDSTATLIAPDEIQTYHYQTARVIGNNVTHQENFFTLNRGLRDDVEVDMAVITPDGCIAGYVLSCSEKFSACISVLNRTFRTGGRFKKAGDYVGSVHWDGVSSRYVTLSDIPKHALIARGDTIVTSEYSSIFPPGLVIGTVEKWTLNDQTYLYDVRVLLAAHIASMREVILVRYMDAVERRELETAVGY